MRNMGDIFLTNIDPDEMIFKNNTIKKKQEDINPVWITPDISCKCVDKKTFQSLLDIYNNNQNYILLNLDEITNLLEVVTALEEWFFCIIYLEDQENEEYKIANKRNYYSCNKINELLPCISDEIYETHRILHNNAISDQRCYS